MRGRDGSQMRLDFFFYWSSWMVIEMLFTEERNKEQLGVDRDLKSKHFMYEVALK